MSSSFEDNNQPKAEPKKKMSIKMAVLKLCFSVGIMIFLVWFVIHTYFNIQATNQAQTQAQSDLADAKLHAERVTAQVIGECMQTLPAGTADCDQAINVIQDQCYAHNDEFNFCHDVRIGMYIRSVNSYGS